MLAAALWMSNCGITRSYKEICLLLLYRVNFQRWAPVELLAYSCRWFSLVIRPDGISMSLSMLKAEIML